MENKDPERKNWLQSLPGILTATAGLIAAITTLIVAMDKLQSESKDGATPSIATQIDAVAEKRPAESNKNEVVLSPGARTDAVAEKQPTESNEDGVVMSPAMKTDAAAEEGPTESDEDGVATSSTAQTDVAPEDPCPPMYFWRLAVPSDHVCVTDESRKRVEQENQRAAERRQVGGGHSGADTCQSGYVWREAYEGDTVCVLPERRDEVHMENAEQLQRIAR